MKANSAPDLLLPDESLDKQFEVMVAALPEFDGYRIDEIGLHVRYPSARWHSWAHYEALEEDELGFRPYRKHQGSGETPVKAFRDLLEFMETWEEIQQ